MYLLTGDFMKGYPHLPVYLRIDRWSPLNECRLQVPFEISCLVCTYKKLFHLNASTMSLYRVFNKTIPFSSNRLLLVFGLDRPVQRYQLTQDELFSQTLQLPHIILPSFFFDKC